MRQAAVLGTGLIGTSIGIGLRAAGWHVKAWDPASDVLAQALTMGSCDTASPSQEEAMKDSDLVFLCGPVRAIIDTLGSLETTVLITDVAGVKAPVVEAGRHLSGFVGGHPMAGRELSGPEGATGSLFRGASWVLTPDNPDAPAVSEISKVIESLGAIPVITDAVSHDRGVASASHLPHLTAVALVEALEADHEALGLAAGGFRDLTRVALSDPGWWVDVLIANRAQVGPAIRRLVTELLGLASVVESSDAEALVRHLIKARNVRSGMAAPVSGVSLILEDQPGEMARVGHSLSESGVDLRDLQLRHSQHGGGGVLTLSVRSSEVEKLRGALIQDGFRLIDPL